VLKSCKNITNQPVKKLVWLPDPGKGPKSGWDSWQCAYNDSMFSSQTSSKDLPARVQRALLEDCRLDPGKPLLAGVSGGPDSLTLLTLLAQLGWQVHAAHFDHHLRPESAMEAGRVAEAAQRLNVPFLSGEGDVAVLACECKLSLEEAARKVRYGFLFDCARRISAQAVVVGHTASDQVETVLMHILRGAGLSGLKGMAPLSQQEGWDPQIPLARPLLRVWREEIEQFCRDNSLEPLQDASNSDTAFFRNRLRHELIPTLEGYNPQFRAALLRSTALLTGDWEVVEGALDEAWVDCWQASGAGYAAFKLATLRGLAPGLLRGLLRRACAKMRPGLRDIDFEDVERAAGCVLSPSRSAETDWVSGLRLFVEEDRLYLEEPGTAPIPAHWPQLAGLKDVLLEAPGRIELANGFSLEAERFAEAPDNFSDVGQDEIWLDEARLSLPFVVHAARPGERFEPLGMGGKSQKLSDLWINARIPRRARELWPLVCSGERIAWIVGLRSSHPFRVGPDSQAVVRLRLVRPV